MSRPDRGVPRMRRLRSVSGIRPCRDAERGALLAIVNAAAVAYRGVIPADRWHEPYMPASELDEEIAAGVAFWGYEAEGALVGVMGVQPVRDVDLGAPWVPGGGGGAHGGAAEGLLDDPGAPDRDVGGAHVDAAGPGSRALTPDGGGGIRTRDPLSRTLVFKTSAFNRSATPPHPRP